jgi:phage FluMu protein Com
MGQTVLNTTKKKRTWVQHVKLAIRKRWVQLCILLLFWLLVMTVTTLVLKPKSIPKEDTSQYKFIRCDVCNLELPYSQETANKKCPKCRPPKVGYMLPQKESIKSGSGQLDPWRWVYSGLFVETLGLLASVVYLLYLPVSDPTKVYYVLSCMHCSQKLRYRAVALGGIGSCSRCKRMLRFPDEEDAVLEVDVLKAEELAAIEEHNRLREEGEAEQV